MIDFDVVLWCNLDIHWWKCSVCVVCVDSKWMWEIPAKVPQSLSGADGRVGQGERRQSGEEDLSEC